MATYARTTGGKMKFCDKMAALPQDLLDMADGCEKLYGLDLLAEKLRQLSKREAAMLKAIRAAEVVVSKSDPGIYWSDVYASILALRSALVDLNEQAERKERG
jgi:hypothetical protein